MAHEVETAVGASLGGLFRRRANHAVAPGTPCANCATPLQGPWCHQCGQLGEDFHRSLPKLIAEAFEGLLHLDSRIWRTLPELILRPAKLTQSYLDGHRAPQIPPLRLFLVVLLLVFVAGAVGGGKDQQGAKPVTATVAGNNVEVRQVRLNQLTPEQKASVAAALDKGTVQILNKPSPEAKEWLKTRVLNALNDPERFYLVLEQWGERFAFLTLPLAAGLLTLLFIFQRRFFIFDHVIFSLHSLSAVGLMLAASIALKPVTFGLAGLIIFAAPVHLFFHMRGVYGASILGTLVRMTLLAIGSSLGGLLIFLGLLWVGLSGMGG